LISTETAKSYGTKSVDLNGDGIHELVRGIEGGDGAVMDRRGREVGTIGGTVAIVAKLLNKPGEHIFAYYSDGKIRIWADRNACDCEAALERYAHPFYKANLRAFASGSNGQTLGGI
jgi:hypothetical protein